MCRRPSALLLTYPHDFPNGLFRTRNSVLLDPWKRFPRNFLRLSTDYRYEFRRSPFCFGSWIVSTNFVSVTIKITKSRKFWIQEFIWIAKTLISSSYFTASQNGRTTHTDESLCLRRFCIQISETGFHWLTVTDLRLILLRFSKWQTLRCVQNIALSQPWPFSNTFASVVRVPEPRACDRTSYDYIQSERVVHSFFIFHFLNLSCFYSRRNLWLICLYFGSSLAGKSAHFQRRVHEGDVQGLAQLALLLLELRREPERAAVRAEGREPLLHQVLRGQVLQRLRGVQEEHRHRV